MNLAVVTERLTDLTDFSGTVCVRRAGEVVFDHAQGLATRRWNVPVTTSTRFDAASIGKVFTAVAVLRLADQGRLDPQARIGEHLDLAGTTLSPDITVSQLLEHRSGIADFDEESDDQQPSIWESVPAQSIRTTADFLPLIDALPPVFPPGTGHQYSNAGYVLLGLVIEAVTGTDYRGFVEQELLRPYRLDRSGFFDKQDPVPDLAEGWDLVKREGEDPRWRQNLFEYPPVGAPDGGIHLTAEDLSSFLWQLRSGQVLSPASTAALLTPRLRVWQRDGQELWQGWCFEFVRDPDGRIRNLHKEGCSPGAGGVALCYPDLDLDVAILGNSDLGFVQALDVLHDQLRQSEPGLGISGV